MRVSHHAADKVRFYKRSGAAPQDLVALQDRILEESLGADTFVVEVPLHKAILDQSHGNWEYRDHFRAIVEDDTLVTVYLV